jgi:phosphoribosyl 1,2-cyclic phosphodiesterase
VRLLIDAGFSGRQIRQRLAQIGRTPESLTGILITHEHTDHTHGLSTLAAKLQIPIYCNRLTKDALERQLGCPCACRLFQTGASFDIGDILVDTFSVPHDAQDPVGFFLCTPAANIGVLTDLGHATKLIVERVRAANVLILETNHDVKMLQEDPHRPWSLKQRILSRHGHLSNEAAAAVAQEIVTDQLRHLYLGHLSRECNRPELAVQTVSSRLRTIGATHVRVEATSQEAPSATLTLSLSQAVQLSLFPTAPAPVAISSIVPGSLPTSALPPAPLPRSAPR